MPKEGEIGKTPLSTITLASTPVASCFRKSCYNVYIRIQGPVYHAVDLVRKKINMEGKDCKKVKFCCCCCWGWRRFSSGAGQCRLFRAYPLCAGLVDLNK